MLFLWLRLIYNHLFLLEEIDSTDYFSFAPRKFNAANGLIESNPSEFERIFWWPCEYRNKYARSVRMELRVRTRATQVDWAWRIEQEQRGIRRSRFRFRLETFGTFYFRFLSCFLSFLHWKLELFPFRGIFSIYFRFRKLPRVTVEHSNNNGFAAISVL
jgi:hypothetical protein